MSLGTPCDLISQTMPLSDAVQKGLDFYLIGAVSRDLNCDWLDTLTSAIKVAPSSMPTARPLLFAISPWGKRAPEIWDRQILAASVGNSHLRTLLKPRYQPNDSPENWLDLSIHLLFYLENQVKALGNTKLRRLLDPSDGDIVKAYVDYRRKKPQPILFNSANSASVLQHAKRLIDAASKAPVGAKALDVAWGLALIGYSCEILYRTIFCAVCFRRQGNGNSICEQHSRQMQPDVKAEFNDNYWKAARLKEFMLRKGKWPQEHLDLTGDNLFRFGFYHAQLFSALEDDISDLQQRICSALDQSPKTKARCFPDGYDLNLDTILKRLRDTLDPEESLETYWPWKIQFAELLETSAIDHRDLKRGTGSNANERITEAIRLAKVGVSIPQIAKTLGVDRTAIYYWRKRSAELRAAMGNK
jgi:hypothetical protein